MKVMKLGRFAIAALIGLMLFASPAFAASPNDPFGGKHSQPLSLTLEGSITSAGNQHYELGGGQLVQGAVGGNALSPGQISLSMSATVHGLSASGRGSLQIPGGHGNDGKHSGRNGASFSMQFVISGAIAAAIFPITLTSPTTFANCDPTTQQCNSEIPLLFTGIATVQSGNGGAPLSLPIAIESPYWNPFGGPILITSLDSTTAPTIFLVVTYSTATIGWGGVQLQGAIAGTFGTETVTGSYNQVTYSQENLVAGTESDAGSIVFSGMSDPVLNARGAFFGHTSFSLAGGFDCAPEFNLPEGTCTATGATSDGSFWMIGGKAALISGTYHTLWSVPSLFTETTVIGAVTTH